MKKILTLALVALLALSMVSAFAEVEDAANYKVLVGASNMSGSFYSWLAKSCQAEVEKLGIKCDIFDFASDDSKVPTMIEQAITGGYTGMILDIPDHDQNIHDLLQEALDAGVYTVNVNNADPVDGICCNIGLDNYTLGKNIGAAAAEMVPEGAKGLIVKATPGNQGSEDRYNGFIDAPAEAGRDDIEILAVQNSKDWSKEGTMTVMEDWTQIYDDFDFLYAPCDDMCCGAVEVCEAAGYDVQKIMFFGIDGLANGCYEVQKGTFAATVLQNANDEATMAAKVLYEMMSGADTSSRLFALDGTIITLDNVEDVLAMHEANGMLN